jgi:hypothetical protein
MRGRLEAAWSSTRNYTNQAFLRGKSEMQNSAVIFIEVGMKNSSSITAWTERK